MRHRPPAALAVLVGMALLAACSSPAGRPSPSPSASPEPSPSASAAPSPSATAADCSAAGVRPGLLNCLDTNLPIVGNPGQDMLVFDAAYCETTPAAGRWIPAGPRAFSLDGQDGTLIARIDLFDATYSTPEGVAIGTPLADLEAAYPGLVTGTAGFDTTVHWIEDENGFVVFEVGEFDETFEPAPANVRFMRILAAGSEPDHAVYATEDIAGLCPWGV